MEVEGKVSEQRWKAKVSGWRARLAGGGQG